MRAIADRLYRLHREASSCENCPDNVGEFYTGSRTTGADAYAVAEADAEGTTEAAALVGAPAPELTTLPALPALPALLVAA